LVQVRGGKCPVARALHMPHMADELGRQYGVQVHEVPVGFKNVAPKMMETGAVLGGEESGGFAIKGHIPERDGILAGLCLPDMMGRSGRSTSQLLEDLEKKAGPHAYARHDIHLPRDSYDQDRRRILETLREKQPRMVAGVEVERVRDDDGFKFFLKGGSWALLRTSGTEPLIRVYAEAEDLQAVDKRPDEREAVVGTGGQRGGSEWRA